MSFVPVTSAATAATTAAAAAQRRRRLQREEEQMTTYSPEDLDGWEFKIVRANTRRFRSPKAVRQLCAEEAKAGWEMVEKFDDSRIRFKRPVERRAEDAYLDFDPYRTQVGIGGNMLELSIAGGIVLVIGLVLLVVLFLRMNG